MRRPPGTGSITSRSRDRHLLSVTIGYDDDGKQIRYYETFHGPKTGARKRLDELCEEFEKNPAARQGLTFKRFAEDKYLPHVKRRRRERTYQGYKEKLTLHLYPMVGDRLLASLRPFDFEDTLDALEDRGMSAASRLHVRRVAMQVMNYAADKGYIESWRSRGVSRPEVQARPKKTLSADEARQYLDLFVDDEIELAVVLGLCAMRPSEICGVQHPDIDLAAGTLHIMRSVHKVKGGFVVEPPKTPESDRTIALTARAIAAYKRHQGVSGYILQRRNGDPMTVDYVWRRYRKKILDAGLRYVEWKYLRHTTGTLALKHRGRKRVDTRAVADLYGHTEQQTFETFYYDRSGVVGRDVVAVLDRIFGE